MSYINTSTSEYPLEMSDIKAANPETAFPVTPTDAQLAPFGYANVVLTDQPDYNEQSQKVEEVTPTNNGAQWNQTWSIVDLSSEEIATRITNAKNQKIDEVWSTYDVIDLTIHMSTSDVLKNKRKHDISSLWSSYGTDSEAPDAPTQANIDTMNTLQSYTAILNGEIDSNTVAINALLNEQAVIDYVIVFTEIPEGLPNASTISVVDVQVGIEYRISAVGNTDFELMGGSATPAIGDVFTTAAVGTGTGMVTPTTVAVSRLEQFFRTGKFSTSASTGTC